MGAAGTFVVRKPGPRAKFRAELLRRLPFEANVVLCDGHDLMRLEMENPFGTEASRPDIVRFVSILSKADRGLASIPCTLPPCGEWFVRVIASKNRFVFGVYRRHMKTIGYLGQIDKLFGVPATTRNWNTIIAIVRILKGQGKKGKRDDFIRLSLVDSDQTEKWSNGPLSPDPADVVRGISSFGLRLTRAKPEASSAEKLDPVRLHLGRSTTDPTPAYT